MAVFLSQAVHSPSFFFQLFFLCISLSLCLPPTVFPVACQHVGFMFHRSLDHNDSALHINVAKHFAVLIDSLKHKTT